MKFSTRLDRDLSADQLFDAISDLPRIERLLMRRGVQVQRIEPDMPQAGAFGWDLAFDWRGKERRLQLSPTKLERPERMSMRGSSESLDLTLDATVVALSRQRARLIFETEIRPRNMRARLMIQTAKLGKAQLDRRFERRILDLVEALQG
ncbi:SRPBCC family protein [Paracoccus homiensis]|uniref:Polyketide cyclase / dehydrase and lipid transport n=1 Tax=Paracoccus homiensis TaxID=364199 RepID=A0A1I0F3Q2_9RHOB|nr:SRPBCC family protein [Paracoccus homiensis]SET51655.1 hypothetical protein SAMN04489858_10636 [Paracoccus homiensis]